MPGDRRRLTDRLDAAGHTVEPLLAVADTDNVETVRARTAGYGRCLLAVADPDLPDEWDLYWWDPAEDPEIMTLDPAYRPRPH